MTKITVYTKNGCPQCDMTKLVLKEEGITFEAINVQEQDDSGNLTEQAEQAFKYVTEELGFNAMPVVETDTGILFTGFRIDKLKALK